MAVGRVKFLFWRVFSRFSSSLSSEKVVIVMFYFCVGR